MRDQASECEYSNCAGCAVCRAIGTSCGVVGSQTPWRVHHHGIKLLLLYEAVPVKVDDVCVYRYAVLWHLP